jgi:hypothetical protein
MNKKFKNSFKVYLKFLLSIFPEEVGYLFKPWFKLNYNGCESRYE